MRSNETHVTKRVVNLNVGGRTGKWRLKMNRLGPRGEWKKGHIVPTPTSKLG